MKKRGATNSNSRGSTLDRKRRRAWLIKHYESNIGPSTVRCFRCGTALTEWGEVVPGHGLTERMTVDRIIPARDGGRYTRGNIRPACSFCNRWRKKRQTK